ncbi:hypothetical protein Q8A57_02590 [Porticoccus litoralis]|jgi:hypothetical protein|uniref:Uncharacterized protein n=1 Tax=Porticoccus litoralis TaxID=434086 RepID=A0AAW8AY55_9GAMM|nr:PA1571 family protein [Porticoccus litoralis]MDP1519846.1 hypothetical protein [Porticoccus litoralis]
MSQQPKDNTSDTTQPPDFHGAAVIDENGNEIPITEDMVQEAFEELEEETADKPNDLKQ